MGTAPRVLSHLFPPPFLPDFLFQQLLAPLNRWAACASGLILLTSQHAGFIDEKVLMLCRGLDGIGVYAKGARTSLAATLGGRVGRRLRPVRIHVIVVSAGRRGGIDQQGMVAITGAFAETIELRQGCCKAIAVGGRVRFVGGADRSQRPHPNARSLRAPRLCGRLRSIGSEGGSAGRSPPAASRAIPSVAGRLGGQAVRAIRPKRIGYGGMWNIPFCSAMRHRPEGPRAVCARGSLAANS
jgi:hypothetical protein